MDLNSLLEETNNGLVPTETSVFGLPPFAGIIRKARGVLLKKFPEALVARMSDNEVLANLFECDSLIPVVIHCKDEPDDEVVFLVPREILERCKALQR